LSMIESNTLFLSASVIKTLAASEPASIEYKESRDGWPVPVLNGQTLHSIYAPLRDAQKSIDRYRDDCKDKNALPVAVGLAGGYHLIEIVKQTGFCVVLCINPSRLKSLLSRIDLSTLYSAGSIMIIMPDEIDQFVDRNIHTRCWFIIHSILERVVPQEIVTAIRTVKRVSEPVFMDTRTKKVLSRRWTRNLLKNVKMAVDGDIDLAPLDVSGKVIVVAGAGPSLEKAIFEIEQTRQDVYLAAADTALQPLLTSGLVPDAVFTFDAQNISLWHFIGSSSINFRLFGDITASIPTGCRFTPLLSSHPLAIMLQSFGWKLPVLDTSTRNIGSAMTAFFIRQFPGHPVLACGIDFGLLGDSLYCRGTTVSHWLQQRSNYHDPLLKGYLRLLGRQMIEERSGPWRSTRQFKQFVESGNLDTGIMSLSDSPFIPWKRAVSIAEIISNFRDGKMSTCEFMLPQTEAESVRDEIEKCCREDKEFNSLCSFAFPGGDKCRLLAEMAKSILG
jgi:hypothetical protein